MPSVALTVLQSISALGSALAAWNLWRIGLARKYRFFFGYLLFRVPFVLIPLFTDIKSGFYEKFFIIGRIVTWVFYVGIVLELYRLVLARHRGFYSLGRWAMSLATAVSLIVSALALLPRITPQMPQATQRLGYVIAAERGIDFSLALFLLLMLAFLNLYTVPLSRNLVTHAALYTIFFLSSSLRAILWNIFGLQYAASVGTAASVVSALIVFAWLFLLSAKGEAARFHLPWYAPEREEKILERLDALNATLLRAGKVGH